jgi:hypothetical protein
LGGGLVGWAREGACQVDEGMDGRRGKEIHGTWTRHGRAGWTGGGSASAAVRFWVG